MLRQLILLAVGTILTAPATIFAQTPIAAKTQSPVKPEPLPPGFSPDAACNEAGTISFGLFTGQSNDHDFTTPSDTIYLCLGDQIEIDHNGDFDLSGDPQAASAPGVTYAFYNCQPTVGGMTLANVLSDPCLNTGGVPPPAGGIWINPMSTVAESQGDQLFKNNGGLQALLNLNDPLLLWFAPITVDDWLAPGYEQTAPNQPIGPCVDVSPQAAFPVVYLNEVKVDAIEIGLGVGGCIGRFRPRGGYSEYVELTTTTSSPYTLSFAGPGPVVPATKPSDIKHGGNNPVLMFSVPGIYTITVEDAKSCGKSFTMDMSGCVATDNVELVTPNTNVQSGQTVCVPIEVDNNFTAIASLQGTINWCPANFQFVSISAGALPNADVFYNQNEIANGQLGFAWFDQTGVPSTFADGTAIFEVCLLATGPIGQCCPLSFSNDLTTIGAGDDQFAQIAVTLDEGTICIGQPDLDAEVTVLSNCTSAGSFQVVVNSGAPNYQMTYENKTLMSGPVNVNFSVSYTVSNLPDGVYSIHVEDALGADFDTTITIFSLSVAMNFTPVTCFGDKDGIAEVVVTANAGATFNYQWSIAAPNVPMLIALPVGPYSVTVTNPASGCTAIASGVLGGQIVRTMFSSTDATCSGIANGAVSFNILGGTPGYTLTFDNGLGTSTTVPYNNPAILAGNYHMTVTDSKGCMRFDSFEIFAQNEYELLTSITNVQCFGQNTGEVTAVLATNNGNPVAPITFTWSAGTVTTVNNTSTASGLIAGVFNVTVTDATGCGVILTDTIKSPAQLITTVTPSDPSCANLSSGSVHALNTTGGVILYNFLWDNGSTGASRNNLTAGTYCVTVTDANGCTAIDCATLVNPKIPIINSVDSTSVACWNSTNGVLTVNAIPGQAAGAPLSYSWNCSTSTTNTASGLACGPCNVVISDAIGCSVTASFDLGCPPRIEFVDTLITAPTCPSDDNGSVCVTVVGGTGAFTYTWQGFPLVTGNCLNNKVAGTYNLTVKDANGCSILGSFQIKDPIGIGANFANLTAASCAGTANCDGSVMVTATLPGSPTATFTYEWIEASIFGQNPTTLCPGTNTVSITDNATGCSIESAITINAPDSIKIAQTVPLITTCFGACDGSVVAQVTGGVLPLQYAWSNGQTTPQATGLCAGSIVVTVTDANGCEKTNTYPLVPEPAEVEVFFDPAVSTNVLCFGGSNGTLGWLVSGGTPAFTWSWSPNVGNAQVLNNLASGQYMVTATDANGCTGTAVANLQENPPILASFDTYSPIKCFGETTNLSVDTVTGGVGPYVYEIDYGPTTPSNIDTRIEGGDHIAIFVDASDCRDTLLFTIDQPAEIGLDLGPDLRIELGDTTQQIFPQFNIQVDSFVWFPTMGLDSSGDLRPFVTTFESQLYTLTIFDANGCSATDELYVEIDPNRKVFIPNIFKPGSTLSDHFRVFVGNGVKSVNYFRIFDRWGEMVHEEQKFFPSNGDYSEGWDGMYRGKRVNPGVYVYLVEVSFLDGRTLLYRGDVTLVRDKE